MKNFPDHPDIERTLRTGYPFEETKEEESCEDYSYEDCLYESRREYELFGE